MRSSLLALVFFALWPLTVGAQDIFERARDERRDPVASRTAYQGRDRVDLRMSADLRSASLSEDRGSGRVGVGTTLDFDFACGKFDVGASLRSLFSRNAREEFLGSIFGYIESELARNALVLACEASPTICQALQHYRVSANAMLGLNYDRCRAIEQAIGDSLEKERAQAIKACVEEKRRAGVPLDRALEECQNSHRVRSLTGDRVTEIDLVEELKRALRLSGDEGQDLEHFIGNRLKYTTQGGTGEITKDAVEREYVRIRERYARNWRQAVEAIEQGQKPTDEVLAGLVPPGSPKVSPTELTELTLLRPALRSVVLASIASQCALLELVRRAHEVERTLEAARKLPAASEETIKKLERERADLRAEILRLTETHERQNEFNRTLLEATSVARANVASNVTRALGQAALDERRFRVDQETQKWGGGIHLPTKASNPPAAGPGCGDCGATSWSFGSVGARR